MKKIILVVLAVLFCVPAFAWPEYGHVVSVLGGMWGYEEASGTWHPIAVNQKTGALAISQAAINASSSVYLGTSITVVAMTNRNRVVLISSGTFAYSVGSTTVSANMPQVTSPVIIDVEDSVPIGVSLATASYLGVQQYGR